MPQSFILTPALDDINVVASVDAGRDVKPLLGTIGKKEVDQRAMLPREKGWQEKGRMPSEMRVSEKMIDDGKFRKCENEEGMEAGIKDLIFNVRAHSLLLAQGIPNPSLLHRT